FQERRKFLARTSNAAWLAKFVGLGRAGAGALHRGKALHAIGITPQIAGLCHGFLIERWHDDAVPLDLRLYDRERLIDHVGGYLGARARHLPAEHRGASLADLLEMARHNTRLALGSPSSALLDRFTKRLPHLERSVEPIQIDGRMHSWEWLVRRDGSLLKTDALDHHISHDLVGCQDVTWDLAGAATELEMAPGEVRRLGGITHLHSGRQHDPELLQLMQPCYLAFQLGRHSLAINSADRGEAHRLRAIVDRYAGRLAAILAS
ncbi:MAG: hypothetical protein H0T42_30280, partial [Deltaproteobacteria bacterium]|nr:hypothetical protein [Deltaproteobacteria bacterium]